jgi:hypothetical protein
MRRRRAGWCALFVLVMSGAGGSPVFADDALAKSLLAVLNAQFAAIDRGDVDAALATIHSASPFYAQTRRALRDLASAGKLHSEVSDFKLIGVDGDYAFARCSEKTTKVSGPEFRDNARDVVEVFRKEGDAWKQWTTAVLTVRYLDGTEGKP